MAAIGESRNLHSPVLKYGYANGRTVTVPIRPSRRSGSGHAPRFPLIAGSSNFAAFRPSVYDLLKNAGQCTRTERRQSLVACGRAFFFEL
jgi:hypothetical protein